MNLLSTCHQRLRHVRAQRKAEATAFICWPGSPYWRSYVDKNEVAGVWRPWHAHLRDVVTTWWSSRSQ